MMTKKQETALFGPEDHEAPRVRRSARFGFKEESDRPTLAYQCPTCYALIHAKYQPLPWRGPTHECRYVLVEPMTEPRASRMPKKEATR